LADLAAKLNDMLRKFHDYFVPVLSYLDQNGPTYQKTLKEELAKLENLSELDLAQTSERGTNIFSSRIHWALQYLYQSGALQRPAQATYAINDLGKRLLSENPNGFDVSVLEDTEGWIQWGVRTRNRQEGLNGAPTLSNEETPNESIEASIAQIESNLAHQLVMRLQEASPQFLEETILELLGRMGYGDGNDSLEHLGGPGDEGVDGVINQDKLGLQRIYIQAKRYKFGNNIGGPALHNFMGALKGKGASGGVFITTSAFTPAALEYVSKNMEPRIVLIDGVELGRLLIQHEVGVIALRTYKVLEIDENFFDE
jgi:restriction system protein